VRIALKQHFPQSAKLVSLSTQELQDELDDAVAMVANAYDGDECFVIKHYADLGLPLRKFSGARIIGKLAEQLYSFVHCHPTCQRRIAHTQSSLQRRQL
jgi:hypothetical protein